MAIQKYSALKKIPEKQGTAPVPSSGVVTSGSAKPKPLPFKTFGSFHGNGPRKVESGKPITKASGKKVSPLPGSKSFNVLP